MAAVWSSHQDNRQKSSNNIHDSSALSLCHHETEVFEGEEGDIPKRFDKCEKNPGHTGFIPITRFQISDLPGRYQDLDLHNVIKAIADLTVRIKVTTVSPHRPEFWPNTQHRYPFSDLNKGTVPLRTGSGEIDVYKFIDGCGYDGYGRNHNVVAGNQRERTVKTCPCKKCQRLEKRKTIWWEIIITTAAHVVFDNSEARHTSCRLFYDDQDSPLVSLDNFTVYNVDIERDLCLLKHVTCDVTIGDSLYRLVEHKCGLWKRVYTKYMERSNFMFIVSHPHGCTKQVSVGRLKGHTRVGEVNNHYCKTKLTYATCTCPGSSGAYVHCLGFSGGGHVHCGTVNASKLNCSGVGLYQN